MQCAGVPALYAAQICTFWRITVPQPALLNFCSCLLAKMPSAAVPVLEVEVFDVDPAKTGMTPRDFLLYCYYGGLIHIGTLLLRDSVQACSMQQSPAQLSVMQRRQKSDHFGGAAASAAGASTN